MQRVIERARDAQQESVKLAIANAELAAELRRRGLLPSAPAENVPQKG